MVRGQASNYTIVGMRKTWGNYNAHSYLSDIIALEVLDYWLLSVPAMLAQSFECPDDKIKWNKRQSRDHSNVDTESIVVGIVVYISQVVCLNFLEDMYFGINGRSTRSNSPEKT